MDFGYTPRVQELQRELTAFMEQHVHPAEARYHEQMREAGDPHAHVAVREELKAEARRRGLWNLFLPDPRFGAGLTNLEYAPLAEITGHSLELAPEALNCAAPDTGNMEILAMFGTPAQQERWLAPLLDGEIRSCFAMTEYGVASSDATNIECSIRREGDEYVINGRKWWTSGALRERCTFTILMGKTDPDGPRHRQQSMVIVPLETPGVTLVRSLPVFGYMHQESHAEVRFEDVRVPVTNLLGEEGDGFAIAQARLGPGRIHHCMRAIGQGEMAFELMCRRARERETFGGPIAGHGVVQDWIAESRMELEQARLMVLKTAWLMDTVGNKGARVEISAIKVIAPRAASNVVDRAIQVHGGAGMSDDVPLAWTYAFLRSLRIADGPDEVHKRSIALRELARVAPAAA